ncbi:MAG: LysM peptidoglycan-binding domain-containing protein [Candidatus Symbiothrix sp.]|jgi:nucleoid-associated protein YgaU|nr:LysM peptidoglycan-binding domain-containing protein [Candidatus Symbiothrix sp.]
MSLQDKYNPLISYAQASNVSDLSVIEKDNVLYISGKASAIVKDEIWKLYDKIDPDMRAGDLVLDIDVLPGTEEVYEVQAGDNLSKIAKKYPGMTWQKIFEANKDILKDPNKIFPKQKLKIPL